MGAVWPQNPVEVDQNLEALKNNVDAVRRDIARRFESSVIRMNELRSEIQSQKSNMEQLKQGRAPVRRNTRELMELLEEYGIESTPICELVDINDDKWRIAVESFLGARREALIVEPDRVKEAITLYRRKGRHLKAVVSLTPPSPLSGWTAIKPVPWRTSSILTTIMPART